jgi:hypothetical protein
MFTKLYLDTTNPNLAIQKWPIIPIIVSVLFHTILYLSFANIVSYIFADKILSPLVNQKLLIFLLLIMSVGFIGRYYHVKEIYGAYNGDLSKTRAHLDKLYISWIFLS